MITNPGKPLVGNDLGSDLGRITFVMGIVCTCFKAFEIDVLPVLMCYTVLCCSVILSTK